MLLSLADIDLGPEISTASLFGHLIQLVEGVYSHHGYCHSFCITTAGYWTVWRGI